MPGFRSVTAACAIGALLVLPATADSRSARVAALQTALRATGFYAGDIDGLRGPQTRRAVRRFQRRAGLDADGVAGPLTRRALGPRGRPSLGRRAIGRIGQHGWDVAELQFLLALHGFPSGSIDGGYGERTRAALLRFQGWAGLTIDGVAGPATFAALRRPPARSPLRFLRPIDAPRTDGFRPRGDRMHTGQDFPAATGTPVHAAGYGCVLSVGDISGYGTTIVIGHRMGMSSLYAHLSAVYVRDGQCVRAGATIGAVGATGIVTGPHLHFELRLRDAAIDPEGAY